MAFCTPLVCLSLVLYPSGRQSHANCTSMAARPILFMLHATGGHAGTIFMLLAATRVQFICDWRPLVYNLYATGRQLHENFACAGGQLRTKPPVFCKHAARTII